MKGDLFRVSLRNEWEAIALLQKPLEINYPNTVIKWGVGVLRTKDGNGKFKSNIIENIRQEEKQQYNIHCTVKPVALIRDYPLDATIIRHTTGSERRDTMQNQSTKAVLNIITYCIIKPVAKFTMYLGVALLPLSGVLLNLWGFLQFSWNQHDGAIIAAVFAGFFFLLGIISFIISGILTWRIEHPRLLDLRKIYGFTKNDDDINHNL